jgi:hypothetical protein
MELRGIAALLLVGLLPTLTLAQSSTNRCRETVIAQGTLPALTNRAGATFNIKAVSRESGSLSGKANYFDRAAGVRFNSDNLTEYVVMDEVSRHLRFETQDSNGVPVSAVFVVCDLGRGTNDLIAAFINNQYERTSHLRRGKVTIRRQGCRTD